MNSFFQSIADANRANCAALGLSAAELYGNPPNAAEVEVHDLIEAGVPAEAADPYVERMNAERLRMRKILVRQAREVRLRGVNYAPGRFISYAYAERAIQRRAAK